MRRNRKRNKIFLLLILLLGISIGFAALATTLKINGNATITKNTWNVYWDRIANLDGVTPEDEPDIGPDENSVPKSVVTWEVDLNTPGDYFEFTVDAVNAGTIDAEITEIVSKYGNSVIPDVIDSEHPSPVPSYIKYSVVYADNNQKPVVGEKLVKASDPTDENTYTRKTYKIRVEYDKDAVTNAIINDMNENGETHTFSFSVKYGQAAPAEPVPLFTLPEGKTKDTLEVGDELCLQDQCFNFVKYDGNDVIMFAKYNLNVGDNAIGTETFLQDSDVIGWNDGSRPTYGNVPFTKTDYWVDESYDLKPEYGDSYPVDIYDPINYSTAPDFSTECNYEDNCYFTPGYSIAYYVEQYKTKLINDYHATIKEARLLTKDEMDYLKEDDETDNCPTKGPGAFVVNTAFWLGTAIDSGYVWTVNVGGNCYADYYDGEYGGDGYGVRPIIVVEKSNL